MYQSTPPNLSVPAMGNIAPGFAPPAVTQSPYPSGNPEIERLRSVHEVYDIMFPEWSLYLAAYEGGPAMANAANLHKHQRENEEDYNDRVKRVCYSNYVGQIVDFFANFIYTETIQRNGGKNETWYQDFIKNVDRRGSNLEQFMMDKVCVEGEVFGQQYIVVDTPKVNVAQLEYLTKQDEEDLGLKPYWTAINPLEVLDWIVDDFDNLQYIKRFQKTYEMIGNEKHRFEKFTEIYPDRVLISRIDVTDVKDPVLYDQEEFANTWGFLPIVIHRFKTSRVHPFVGVSGVVDFSKISREVMNYTSLIQEFLYRQCFNILAKEAEGNIPFRDQLDGEWGSANVMEYPKGATLPAYISPPIDPAEFLQSERSKHVSEMFKLAAQETMNELMNGEKSSGFSQAQSFSKTVPFISTRADNLERTETKLMMLTMKLIGKEWDGKIKYKDRYEITNITDVITQLTSIFRDLMLPSPTFLKEELKRVVAEFDGKIQADKLKTIYNEIDALDFPEFQENQLAALVGQGSSPAEQQAPKQTGTMAEAASEAKTTKTAATTKVKPPQNKAA